MALQLKMIDLDSLCRTKISSRFLLFHFASKFLSLFPIVDMLSLLFLSPGNYCWLFIVSLYLGTWMTAFIFQKRLSIPIISCTSHLLCSKEPYLYQSEFQGEASLMLIGQQSHRPAASLASRPSVPWFYSWSLDKFSIFIWHEVWFLHSSEWLRALECPL